VSKVIDDESYGWGYDQGYYDGREDGYSSGWRDCADQYDRRVAELRAEIEALRACLTAEEK
jgi:flagellar biosynthesis/type III secretory pathway protein FliH